MQKCTKQINKFSKRIFKIKNWKESNKTLQKQYSNNSLHINVAENYADGPCWRNGKQVYYSLARLPNVVLLTFFDLTGP